VLNIFSALIRTVRKTFLGHRMQELAGKWSGEKRCKWNNRIWPTI